MVKVAIAGGTSPTLGKSLVEAILATKKHDVLILSRKSTQSSPPSSSAASNNKHSSKYGAPIVSVDYASTTELTSTLQSHGVHTLISVLKVNDPTAMITYHKHLLDAAQSAKVSRFILSDWSLAPTAHSRVDLLQHKAALHTLGAERMFRASTANEHVVECCTIQNGAFFEYFAQGCGRPAVQAGLDDDLMRDVIDVEAKRVVVPCARVTPAVRADSGSEPEREPAVVTLTSLVDIGRFVAAALDLPSRQLTGQVGIVGCNVTCTAVAEILSAMRPSRDVELTYITKCECDEAARGCGGALEERMKEKGEVDVGFLKLKMVCQTLSCQCDGVGGGGRVTGRTLNDLCPEVKPVDIRDFLSRAWSSA